MDHLPAELGRILRRHRERAGLSQEELAEAAGLHRTYVGLIERGVRSPTVVKVVGMCQALGVPSASVIGELEDALRGAADDR